MWARAKKPIDLGGIEIAVRAMPAIGLTCMFFIWKAANMHSSATAVLPEHDWRADSHFVAWFVTAANNFFAPKILPDQSMRFYRPILANQATPR